MLAYPEFCPEQFCFCRPLLALNEENKIKKNICELLQHSQLVKNFPLRAVLACAESNFLNFKLEYLYENEFLRKNILACLSGA